MVERAVQVRQGLAGLTTQSPWIGQMPSFGSNQLTSNNSFLYKQLLNAGNER